ncbi:Nucleoside-diphosphate-sugar epimerase [Salinimicrobium sediminis]|uniref:Nucleoside-diphosphate-sugar epimerase n=1 Tax=Salinimicrobium sediminis TaxID=1343891 RepID=A0A285X4S1_9FLAO|nr:NAD(P)-dependent oxidoreductase [Salinimicrobium sediminis]SOC80331.1 Nucleoside-diphosphate-sugar epimerase [Salinimicrobium sediminis]
MKIFLTGGTGFVGSHFLCQAMQQGHIIRALKRAPDSKTKIQLKSQPEWIDKSMEDVEEEDFKNCEVLVHLAAHSANFPYDTLENCIRYNVLQPLALFKKAKDAGIKSFVVAGTCFEYGTAGERYDYIPTDAPLEPTNTYSTSKAMATLAFKEFARDKNVSISIQRIFQVYGTGELETRLWPSLKKAALSGLDFPMTKGEQIRDFVSVEEVAGKLIIACDRIKETGDTFHISIQNLGSGNPQSIYDFSKFWWQKWGAKGKLLVGKLPYRENEVMRFVPEV